MRIFRNIFSSLVQQRGMIVKKEGRVDVKSTLVVFGETVVKIPIKIIGSSVGKTMVGLLIFGILVLMYTVNCFTTSEYILLRLVITVLFPVVVVGIINFNHTLINLILYLLVGGAVYYLIPKTPVKICESIRKPVSHIFTPSEANQLIMSKFAQCEAIIESKQKICLPLSFDQFLIAFDSLNTRKINSYGNNFLLSNGKEKITGKKNLKKLEIPVDPITPYHAHYIDSFNVYICDSTADSIAYSFHYRFQNLNPLQYKIDTIEEVGVDTFLIVTDLQDYIRWVLVELDYSTKRRLNRNISYYALRPKETFRVVWKNGWTIKFVN